MVLKVETHGLQKDGTFSVPNGDLGIHLEMRKGDLLLQFPDRVTVALFAYRILAFLPPEEYIKYQYPKTPRRIQWVLDSMASLVTNEPYRQTDDDLPGIQLPRGSLRAFHREGNVVFSGKDAAIKTSEIVLPRGSLRGQPRYHLAEYLYTVLGFPNLPNGLDQVLKLVETGGAPDMVKVEAKMILNSLKHPNHDPGFGY